MNNSLCKVYYTWPTNYLYEKYFLLSYSVALSLSLFFFFFIIHFWQSELREMYENINLDYIQACVYVCCIYVEKKSLLSRKYNMRAWQTSLCFHSTQKIVREKSIHKHTESTNNHLFTILYCEEIRKRKIL